MAYSNIIGETRKANKKQKHESTLEQTTQKYKIHDNWTNLIGQQFWQPVVVKINMSR